MVSLRPPAPPLDLFWAECARKGEWSRYAPLLRLWTSFGVNVLEKVNVLATPPATPPDQFSAECARKGECSRYGCSKPGVVSIWNHTPDRGESI